MNREGLRARRRLLAERIHETALCWSPTMDTCKPLGPSILVANGNFTLMGAYHSWQTVADNVDRFEDTTLLYPRRVDVFEAMGRYISQYLSSVAVAVLMLRLERDLEGPDLIRNLDSHGLKTWNPVDSILQAVFLNDPESAEQIRKAATMLGVDPLLKELNQRHQPACYGPFFRMLGVLVLDDAMEFV